MATESCVIRDYCSADLSQYVRLHADAQSICHSNDKLFLASLTGESPEHVGFSEKDLFLIEKQGRIVGACRVVPELAIGRTVLRLTIIPDLVDQKIITKLLLCALERARELKVARVHADLREKDQAARDLFTGLGFTAMRRYSEMTLNLGHTSMAISNANLRSRPLKSGSETELTQLQNHVFDGSWGFCPNRTSEIIQLLNTKGYGHEGVIIACHDRKAVGYCWTATIDRSDRKDGAVIGRIHMMGILPEFRGQGLGRYILWSGLYHLREKGIQTVELTVDNDNRAACSLYDRTGFKLKTAVVWYEKRVSAD
jgi:mycothiol synthase